MNKLLLKLCFYRWFIEHDHGYLKLGKVWHDVIEAIILMVLVK